MQFVAARCPQCAGDLQLDNEKETGFCMYCGSKIVVQEAIRAVRIDNTYMIEKWMKTGDLAAEGGNLSEAYEYYTKVVEVQPDNWLAIYKKGKAAGWQSTLADLRFKEATNCFGQAINLAPENEKEKLKDDCAEEVKKLAVALISLRAERFIKWPDEDEANGFLHDIVNIYDAALQLHSKSGFVISGFIEPIAAGINASVITAWSRKIKPDYPDIRNLEYASKFEFEHFIDRIGYCTMLIKQAIDLSGEDDEEDIQRYKNLIMLHEEAIKSCSWSYRYTDGWEQRDKEYQLSEDAKQVRRNLISEYNIKIRQIKNKIRQQEIVEQQEKERKAKEEAQQRVNEYWYAHTKEKAQLESERKGLSDKITNLEKERVTLSSPLLKENNNIHARIEKIRDEQKVLGLFKVKEKKALQAQIVNAQNDIKANTSELNKLQNPIIAKIDGLRNRIEEIDNELKKPR